MAEDKQDSGALNRAKAKEEISKIEKEEKARKAKGVKRSPIEPPPRTAIGNVAWAGNAAALVLEEILNDPVVDARTRWKLALDAVRAIGMTHSKALSEEKMLDIEKKIGLAKDDQDDDGLDPDEQD